MQGEYSRDADQTVAQVAGDFVTALRIERGHALKQARFDALVEWIVGCLADQAREAASPDPARTQRE